MTNSTRNHLAALALLLGATLAGCGFQQRPGQRSRLVVEAEPSNARLTIDDRGAGTAAATIARPRPLVPGQHRITLEAPGYFPHDLLLELPPGETRVQISLRPIPE